MSTFVDGVGASQNIDTAGEVIDIMGMDISSLAVNGVANFEHESKLPDQIVGKVLKAKKIFSEKDCENDREMYFWKKTEIAFVYVLIELFDDYKDSAKEVAGMFRYDMDRKGQNEKNVMNFSIEGAKIEKQGNVIVKSIARKVTITVLPANHMAIAEIVPADNKKAKDDIDSLFKTESSFEIELIKTEDIGDFLKKMAKSINSRIPPKPPENKGSSIGKTSSGKEVFSHERVHNYQGFSGQDHKDAAALHHEKTIGNKDAKLAQHHLGKRNLHLQAAESSEKRATRMDRAGSTVKSGIGGGDKIKPSVHRPYIEVKDKPPVTMKKALTAGSGMAAPGNLTGGAALAKQCVDPKMHKGCEHGDLAKSDVKKIEKSGTVKKLDMKMDHRQRYGQKTEVKGVHQTVTAHKEQGQSMAGMATRNLSSKNPHSKELHTKVLSELKAMPKPNLTKSEDKPDKSTVHEGVHEINGVNHHVRITKVKKGVYKGTASPGEHHIQAPGSVHSVNVTHVPEKNGYKVAHEAPYGEGHNKSPTSNAVRSFITGKVKEHHETIKKSDNHWFNQAKDQYEQWENKEQFVKFMSKRMPKMTKSEIDVFGATMLLKKSMDSENALESLMKSEEESGHAKVGDIVHLHMPNENEKIKGVVKEIHTKEMGMGGKDLPKDKHVAHVETLEDGRQKGRHPKGDRYFVTAKHGPQEGSNSHITPHKEK